MILETPLLPNYEDADGVKLVDYFGWKLPLQFESGIVAEHHAVRRTAGIFDVSHMARIRIAGAESEALVDWLFTNTLPELDGARYGFLCSEDGGIVDDVLVYRFSATEFEIVANAANRATVFDWITSEAGRRGHTDLEILDRTRETVQIALQGPQSETILSHACNADFSSLALFHATSETGSFPDRTIVSRTGYTGEDGFEIYADASAGTEIWSTIIESGSRYDLSLCGLGARDTLRFEAALPLYGHEIDSSITPIDSSLGRFVDFDKAAFSGSDHLLKQRSQGAKFKRIGFELIDRGVPREGHEVFHRGTRCGRVTSGGKCHSVGIFAAMALVDSECPLDDDTVEIEIRGRRLQARHHKLPFYRRRKTV